MKTTKKINLNRKVAEFLEKELSEAQVTSLAAHLDFNAMRNNPATNRASTPWQRVLDDL